MEENKRVRPNIGLTEEIKEYLHSEKIVPQESYCNVIKRMKEKIEVLEKRVGSSGRED